jgi:hypothetical protein
MSQYTFSFVCDFCSVMSYIPLLGEGMNNIISLQSAAVYQIKEGKNSYEYSYI